MSNETKKEVKQKRLEQIIFKHTQDTNLKKQGWPAQTGPDEYYDDRMFLLEYIQDQEEEKSKQITSSQELSRDINALKQEISSLQTKLNNRESLLLQIKSLTKNI